MPRLEGDSGRLPRTLEEYLTALNLDALAAEGLAPHEEQALAQLAAAAAAAAPPMLTGAQLYDALNQHTRVLGTGCDSIDSALLHTGLRTGQVVEVCGESASGKTQLCMAAAVQAARAGLRVVYVDTSNAVSGRRLEQLLAAQAQAPGAVQAVADPLKFVEVRRCYEVHSLLRTLDELAAQQAQQAQQQQQQQQQQADGAQQGGGAAPSGAEVRRRLQDLPIQLLVVDSLSAVIAPVLGGGQTSQGHALLSAAALALKSLAASCNAAVLVTNHLVGGSGDQQRHEKRPAMGETWRAAPHARIQLWRPSHGGGPEPVRCTATLRASTLQAAGATSAYYLLPGGLLAQPAAAAAAAAAQGAGAMQL